MNFAARFDTDSSAERTTQWRTQGRAPGDDEILELFCRAQVHARQGSIGAQDVCQEMIGSGELYETLGLEPVEVVQPKIEISPSAAEALQRAAAEHGGTGREFHLSVDATFQSHLSIAPRTPTDVEAITSGAVLLLDPLSASRADGITINVADTPDGQAFRVDNPNAPRAQSMSLVSRVLAPRIHLTGRTADTVSRTGG